MVTYPLNENPGLSLERKGHQIIIMLKNFQAIKAVIIMLIFKAHLHYSSFLVIESNI